MIREHSLGDLFTTTILEIPFDAINRTVDLISGSGISGNINNSWWDQSLQAWVFWQSNTDASGTTIVPDLNLPSTPLTTPEFMREYDFYPMRSRWGNIIILGHQHSLVLNHATVLARTFCVTPEVTNPPSPLPYNFLQVNTWYHIKEIFHNGTYKCFVNNSIIESTSIQQITDQYFDNTTLYITASGYVNGCDAQFAIRNLIYKA